MAYENENLVQEPASSGEAQSVSNTEPAKGEHHSNWIEKALEGMDSDFPLSGGETDENLNHVIEAGGEIIEETVKKVDVDFPLSGAETE